MITIRTIKQLFLAAVAVAAFAPAAGAQTATPPSQPGGVTAPAGSSSATTHKARKHKKKKAHKGSKKSAHKKTSPR